MAAKARQVGSWSPCPPGRRQHLPVPSEALEPTLRPLPCTPSTAPTIPHTSPTLSQGYSIASGHPVVRQKGDKDPKADHSEEEVQQPGHNLEWVRGPAPPIPA